MRVLGTSFHCLVFLYAFCLLQCVIVGVSQITEKEILLQFKGNISSDPSDILRSWDPSKSPCQDYSGVFCNSDGNVVRIVLWNTGLGGVLSPALSGLKSLRIITLFGNNFTGNVPVEYGEIETLWKINLSSNALSGSIPEFLGDLPNIRFLDLSRNGYTGEIPSALFKNCYKTRNALYGEIPPSITKCNGLKYLDLGFNRLSGSIPVGISDLKNLLVIRLANNSIEGTIPTEFGSIEWLEVLDLHNLRLGGEIPSEITKCKFLLEMDFSGNSLEGGVPQNLDNMTYLEILDLHHNQLNGSIPLTIGNLFNIHSLDFSENLLSGPIPSSLGNLKILTHFNVSYNNLSGVIPSIQSIQQFGFSAFFHNPGLCGAPLENSCSGVTATPVARKPKLSASAIVAIVAAALIVTGVCIITNQMSSSGNWSSSAKVYPQSTREAGTKALLDKECLIGGGSIGTVYRTTFEGGIAIAVKKLETLGRIRNQDEFEHEIGRLGNLQHPNLVAVQGYYWSSSMQLILLEFVSKGNLYDNLHGLGYPGTSTGSGNPELNWSRRFHIAVGTARALAYLHHDCKPPVLHLNIKSTNILLDENYTAKLSDYGLGKLLPLLENYGFTKIHNAVGYIAPELAQSSRLSDKCDVYSFGVILLELVTGRKPVERAQLQMR
ncbi:UNVERIFIED_CONTAM: putative LRR receptor-like serine/threonine-protein kinase [Sesamum radiatum]|uniref:LRR receptor-like serine/threonine-protein kinase n=1 Tax=Sesamum radiatum TaxID=300843 RepID=A0AAW2TYH6_SESRA